YFGLHVKHLALPQIPEDRCARRVRTFMKHCQSSFSSRCILVAICNHLARKLPCVPSSVTLGFTRISYERESLFQNGMCCLPDSSPCCPTLGSGVFNPRSCVTSHLPVTVLTAFSPVLARP